jgi:hypothetical protein
MGKLIDKFKNGFRKQNNHAGSLSDAGPTAAVEKRDEAVATEGNGYNGKLVVVGRESEFPRDLVDYAMDMAQRLSYEIVALNTAPLSCETFKIFSSSRSKLCQDFQELSEKAAACFREEVVQKGIAFTHVVKFSDTDDALRVLQEEIGDIDFIVSDIQEATVQEVTSEGIRAESEIVVYAMVK